jgi:hypothetical protein
VGTKDGEEMSMGTSSVLPHPDVCKTVKYIDSADFWTCLAPDPDPCHYLVKIGEIMLCSIASRRGTVLKRKLEGKQIPVRYADASLGAVSRAQLDKLIEAGSIAAFKRSSGWVDITRDPIRKTTSHWQFRGLQRRAGR